MKTLPDLVQKLNIKDYDFIVEKLGREPNDFELYLFSAMYSEHCGYKHSRKLLQGLYRDGAVFCEENAGGIELGEYTVVFKTESHNHPSAVEPLNGAATGIGGIVRDVLAMNARPVALMNSLKFGSLDKSENKRLLEGVVDGISNYGNCIGVPNIGGEIEFNSCYDNQPLVNVMAVGLVKTDEVVTSKSGAGLSIVLLGSKTGRDGLGGAAFASKELDDRNENRLSVQIADPFAKKKLIEATLEILALDGVKSCQDCGAAGILSSTSEMGYKSNCGVELHLDKVHTIDESITPQEIMLSESQERMVFTVGDDIEKVFEIASKYELDVSIIGETINLGKYEIYNDGELLTSMPYDVLAKAPLYDLKFDEFQTDIQEKKIEFNEDNVKKLVASENFCSKNYIYEQYDHTVQGRNVIAPEKSGVGAIWLPESDKVLGFSMDSNPYEVWKNPYQGTASTIIESYKNLLAAGFEPKGLTNCLNFGNPEKSDVAYQFFQTVNAMRDICEILDVPVVSGNVSFYNEYGMQKIYPTPTISMMGICDFENITRASFEPNEMVILVGERNDIPNTESIKRIKEIKKESCINITRGGVFGSLFRGLERSNLGFDGYFDLNEFDPFKTYINCFLISVKELDMDQFRGWDYQVLGRVNTSNQIKIGDITLSKQEFFELYRNSLQSKMSLQ